MYALKSVNARTNMDKRRRMCSEKALVEFNVVERELMRGRVHHMGAGAIRLA